MRTNVHAQIYSSQSLTSRDDGKAIFNLLSTHAPELLPDRYGGHDPLQKGFDMSKLDSVLKQWDSCFFWRKSKPLFNGSVFMATGKPTHGDIHFRGSSKAISSAKLVEIILSLSDRFAADFSFAHLLNEPDVGAGLESEAVGYLSIGKRPTFNMFIPSWMLEKYLPDLYWLTIFGPPYVDLFGRERLLSAPAPIVEALPTGAILIQLSENMLDFRDRFEEVDRVRQAVKEHLDSDAFFDPAKGKDHKYNVPVFRFPNRPEKPEPPVSYSLVFTGAREPVAEQAFDDYFKSRPGYTRQGRRAIYSNDDTGVAFVFDYEGAMGVLCGGGDLARWASFGIVHPRARFFGSEALVELEAFIHRFGTGIRDPQHYGISGNVFSADAFLRGWEQGNRLACQALAALGKQEELLTRPAEELARIWQWNYHRPLFQQQVEPLFVPKVVFFRTPEGLRSGSIWGDGIPAVLPRTDLVIVYRDELRTNARGKPEIAAAPWESLAQLLGRYRRGQEPLEHVYLDLAEPPRELVDWLRKVPLAEGFETLPMEKVLDADLAAP